MGLIYTEKGEIRGKRNPIFEEATKNGKIIGFNEWAKSRNYEMRNNKSTLIKEKTDAIAKRNFLINLKTQIGCQFPGCKENEHFILVVHHEGKRNFYFSNITKHTWSEIMDELKKCLILCRNCHRRIHYLKINLDGVTNGEENLLV